MIGRRLTVLALLIFCAGCSASPDGYEPWTATAYLGGPFELVSRKSDPSVDGPEFRRSTITRREFYRLVDSSLAGFHRKLRIPRVIRERFDEKTGTFEPVDPLAYYDLFLHPESVPTGLRREESDPPPPR